MPTIDGLLIALKLFSALGCGLMAGFFFAFSVVVMTALSRLPPPQGIAAMQNINVVVLNPLFFVGFFGTAAACLLLVILALLRWHQPGSAYLFVGSLLYLVGTVLVTMVFNVPLNEALASVKPDNIEAANLWANYLVNWTAWNHLRTLAALLASALLTIALYSRTSQ
jgi:uncharacterized membrane protein